MRGWEMTVFFFSHRMTSTYIYVALLALCESLCFCLYISVKGCSVTLRVALIQCVVLFWERMQRCFSTLNALCLFECLLFF